MTNTLKTSPDSSKLRRQFLYALKKNLVNQMLVILHAWISLEIAYEKLC